MSNYTINSKRFHGKPCIKCGSTLRYKSSRGCVACAAKRIRERRKRNPAKWSAYGKKWFANNHDKKLEYGRKYLSNNREKMRVRCKEYYAANRKKELERKRAYRKKHPDRVATVTNRYRTRKQYTQSELYDFKAICNHYDNRCVKCGEQKPLTRDHIKPISKGGPDIASNIQPLCQSCNSSKGARNIDYRPDAGPLRWVQRKLFG